MSGTVCNTETIMGIVSSAAWDEDGDVIAIKICTRDEKEYAVKNSLLGYELFDYIRKEVRIVGQVAALKDGGMEILVKDYEVIRR